VGCRGGAGGSCSLLASVPAIRSIYGLDYRQSFSNLAGLVAVYLTVC
jgi:hypothetical protein